MTPVADWQGTAGRALVTLGNSMAWPAGDHLQKKGDADRTSPKGIRLWVVM